MKEVCERHGALFILDEVMSGMGRTGTLHAWEQEDVVPDLQTMAKGLGAGYAPIAGLLLNKHVVDTLTKGTGAFVHSQTYQGHPVSCAAAVRVQQIIQEDNLLPNVREMGDYLGQLLHEKFDDHPRVGEVRGRGLFWAVSEAPRLCLEVLLTMGSLNLCRTRKRRSHIPRLESFRGLFMLLVSSLNMPSL
jgi:adenosylmethionine-8-amino-7-oxononanoate aminotransferase